MRYVSTYYNQNLKRRQDKFQLTFSGTMALLSFGIIASYFRNTTDGSLSKKGRLISRAINGFQNMNEKEVLLVGLVSFIIGLIVLLILNNNFRKRNIVVAFELDQLNNKLKLETKSTGNSERQSISYNLSDIAFTVKNLKDGLHKKPFDCLVFQKDLKPIGYLFLNHPMWMNYDEKGFQKHIDLVKSLIV